MRQQVDRITSDLKWLRYRVPGFHSRLVALMPLFMLAFAALHLWLAGICAKALDLSLAGGFQRWIAHIRPHRLYYGIEIEMRDNFLAATMFVLFAVFFVLMEWISREDRQRRARLAAYIDSLSAEAARARGTGEQ